MIVVELYHFWSCRITLVEPSQKVGTPAAAGSAS
jgi:hypothetical protein